MATGMGSARCRATLLEGSPCLEPRNTESRVRKMKRTDSQRRQERENKKRTLENPRTSARQVRDQGGLGHARCSRTGAQFRSARRDRSPVRENIYDTATGEYLLIPQGSRLVGDDSSRVSYGQTGIQVVRNRIVFPDGRRSCLTA
jgi:hypothetical protein